jgi:hypothetical protein
MRGEGHSTEEGADRLVEHVRALAVDAERGRPPRERLSERIGRGLSDLLVTALAGDQGMRRRRRRS